MVCTIRDHLQFLQLSLDTLAWASYMESTYGSPNQQSSRLSKGHFNLRLPKQLCAPRFSQKHDEEWGWRMPQDLEDLEEPDPEADEWGHPAKGSRVASHSVSLPRPAAKKARHLFPTEKSG